MNRNQLNIAKVGLILSGLSAFGFSLILPSVHTKVWEAYQTLSGSECVVFGGIFAVLSLLGGMLQSLWLGLLANIVLASSLLRAIFRRPGHYPGGLMFLQTIGIFLAPLWPEFYGLEGTTFLFGYYLWGASYLLIACGLLLDAQSVATRKPVAT